MNAPRALGTKHTQALAPIPVAGAATVTPSIRSRTMHLMPENLARAQIEDRHREAEAYRQVVRVRAARKARRRAERAAQRACRALAIAVTR